MARTFPKHFLRNILVSGDVFELDEAQGAGANNDSVINFPAAGLNSRGQWDPYNTGQGTSPNIPAPGTAPTNKGWREDASTVAGDRFVVNVTATALEVNLRYRRSGQALEVDQAARIVAILYRVTSAGAFVEELERAEGNVTFTTTVQSLLLSFGGNNAWSFDAGDKFQIEVWVECQAAGTPTPPAVATDLWLTTDENSATNSSWVDPKTYKILYARALAESAPAAEALTRRTVVLRAMAESAPAAEALTRRVMFPRALAESAPAIDTLARRTVQARALAESAPASEALTRRAIVARSLAESAPSSEALARRFVGGRAFAESAPSSDALGRQVSYIRPLHEAPGGHVGLDLPGSQSGTLVPSDTRLNFGDLMALDFWIRADPQTGFIRLMSKSNFLGAPDRRGWDVRASGSGSATMGLRIDTSDAQNMVRDIGGVLDGARHHVCWVLDNGVCRGYRDGVPINFLGGQTTYSHGTGFDVTDRVSVGGNFVGEIWGLRYWHRALSDAEVLARYQLGAFDGTEAFDDFERSDGALGANWTVGAGAAAIVSGRARITAGAGVTTRARHAEVLESADVYAEATVAAGGNAVGVTARMDDPSSTDNMYMIRYQGGELQLFRLMSSAPGNSKIASVVEATPPVPYRLRIEVEGTEIRGYVNGVLKLTATDSNLAGPARAGLRAFDSQNAEYDDFEAGIVPTGLVLYLPAWEGVGHTIYDHGPYQLHTAPLHANVGWVSEGSLTDVLTRSTIVARALAESAPATDTLTRRVLFPRALAESAPSAEVLTRRAIFNRALAESAPATEALARSTVVARALAESAPSAEALARQVIYARTLNENIGPEGGGGGSEPKTGGSFTVGGSGGLDVAGHVLVRGEVVSGGLGGLVARGYILSGAGVHGAAVLGGQGGLGLAGRAVVRGAIEAGGVGGLVVGGQLEGPAVHGAVLAGGAGGLDVFGRVIVHGAAELGGDGGLDISAGGSVAVIRDRILGEVDVEVVDEVTAEVLTEEIVAQVLDTDELGVEDDADADVAVVDEGKVTQ